MDCHLCQKLKVDLEDNASISTKISKMSWRSISKVWRQPSMKWVLESLSTGITNVLIFKTTLFKNKFDCTWNLVIKLFCYSNMSLWIWPSTELLPPLLRAKVGSRRIALKSQLGVYQSTWKPVIKLFCYWHLCLLI